MSFSIIFKQSHWILTLIRDGIVNQTNFNSRAEALDYVYELKANRN